jgi:hypothetical protein
MSVLTKEERDEIYRQALAACRPKAPPPKPPAAETKAQERFAEANKPTKNIINDAAAHNDALTRRMQAEAEGVRIRYQRELDRWWQSKLDAEAALDDGYDYSTGYRERRYRTTCHRGRGDPDYGL